MQWPAREASTFETLLPPSSDILLGHDKGDRKGRSVSWQKHFAMICSEAQG